MEVSRHVAAAGIFNDLEIQLQEVEGAENEICLSDRTLANVLGLTRDAIRKMVLRHPEIEAPEYSFVSARRNRRYFTEEGIYIVLMHSNSPKAWEFQMWLARLLKSLRRGDVSLHDANGETISREVFDQRIEEITGPVGNMVNLLQSQQQEIARLSKLVAGIYNDMNFVYHEAKEILRPEAAPKAQSTNAAMEEAMNWLEAANEKFSQLYPLYGYIPYSLVYKVVTDKGINLAAIVSKIKKTVPASAKDRVDVLYALSFCKRERHVLESVLEELLNGKPKWRRYDLRKYDAVGSRGGFNAQKPNLSFEDVIKPLAELRQDKSTYNCQVYRVIYMRMSKYGVDWETEKNRYTLAHNGRPPKNYTDIIKASARLYHIFMDVAEAMILELR